MYITKFNLQRRLIIMNNLQTRIEEYLKYCKIQKRLDAKTLKAYKIDLAQDVYKRQLCEELNARYGDTIIGYQNSNSVDIVCQGNSKGTGIKFVKKYLKANKIYGIGDSYNDLPMLETVDVSFTFHSSPKSVQKQATHLVSGIAEAIDIIEQENEY